MKKKKSTLKIFFKDGLGFNLKDTLDSFDKVVMVLFGALFGGLVSISIYKNQTNLLIWIIVLILIFAVISTILKTIKSVKNL